MNGVKRSFTEAERLGWRPSEELIRFFLFLWRPPALCNPRKGWMCLEGQGILEEGDGLIEQGGEGEGKTFWAEG